MKFFHQIFQTLLFLLLTILPLIISEQIYSTIKDLRSNPLGVGSTQDLVRVDIGISENYPNTRVVYYIDVNNDKMVDIIGVTRNGAIERVVFFIYDQGKGKFEYQELTGVYYNNAYIENVIANDFNGDEYIDLMITVNYKETNKTQTHILLYDQTTSIYKTVHKFLDVKSGIIVADLGDTRGLDFLFHDEESGTRKYLYFDENSNAVVGGFNELISKDFAVCDRSVIHSDYPLTDPHSSAFVDIDGDCINDLIIMSNKNDSDNSTQTNYFLEIWRGVIEDEKIKYCLTQSSVYQLDAKLGLFSLADIDRDSLLDIVFPIKGSSPPQILIAYNKVPLSYDWTADYCATHNKFVLNPGVSLSQIKIPIVFDEPRIDPNSRSKTLKLISLTSSPLQTFFSSENAPTYLRFGDINQDSYPDFTVVLYDKGDYSQNAYIFLNSAYQDENKVTYEDQRTYSLAKSYMNPYVNNAIYSSFFDMDEDGKLDMIIVKQENNNIINTEGYFNTNVYDSFYLKSLVSNQQTAFFGNELGTSFRFITTNIDGSRRMDFASQAIQVSTQLSLNLPYAYIGIGRSNNYIENFSVISGIFVKPSYNYKVFTPIIPNSQIIIRHFKDLKFNEKINNHNQTSTNSTIEGEVTQEELVTWHLDLIVKPTKNLPILITLIVIILMSLLVSITYLHLKETKEDTAQNQREFQFW